MKKTLTIFVMVIALIAINFNLYATDITSAQTGIWNASATWVGGVIPGASDNVIIANGHTVTQTTAAAANCTNITINTGGILIINGTGTAKLTVSGTVIVNGTLTIIAGQLQKVTGPPGLNTQLIINNGSLLNYDFNNGTNLAAIICQNGSTVACNGSAAIILPVNMTSIYNLTINNSAGITLGAGTVVSGALTLTNGSLIVGPFTLFIDGSSVTRTGGNINATNISSMVTFRNTSPISLPASTFSGDVLVGMTLDGTGGITLGSSTTISGSLTLSNGTINSTSSNKLILGTGANVSPGSVASFIIGPVDLIRNTTGIKSVPVGFGTDYRSIGINPSSTTATTYTIEFKNGPLNINNLTFPLVKVSQNDYVDIARTAGADAILTIGWTYEVGITNMTDLRIAHYSMTNSSWEEVPSSSTGISTAGTITSTIAITSFSPFAFGSISDQPLPVQLSSFTSNIINRDVKLNWTTATETNNSGFEIQRSGQNENGNWTKVGYVTGNGTKTTPTNYSFDDKNLNTGKYNYRLKQIDYNGNFEYFNLAGEIEIGVPNKFNISQNYPNPFNPTTKIDFDLPIDSRVSIKLYDMSGREVMTLVNEQRSAGYYTVQMNGINLSSGMYFYRIIADGNRQNFVSAKKLLMIK